MLSDDPNRTSIRPVLGTVNVIESNSGLTDILLTICIIIPTCHCDSQDTDLDPGEDVALLSVSFEDAEATQVFPKLYLSPSIEQ